MSESPPQDERSAYWQQWIDAWQSAKQSQLAFCKANDLNYSNFRYWLRKHLLQTGSLQQVQREPSGFVPVVTAPSVEPLTVCLPSGIELRGVSSDNLAVVEQLLRQLR